jgi:ATP-dependent Clp protease ATP-binding subunit ClpA
MGSLREESLRLRKALGIARSRYLQDSRPEINFSTKEGELPPLHKGFGNSPSRQACWWFPSRCRGDVLDSVAMALAHVLCPTLIGREAEVSVLEDALLSALRGDGGVVIVGGEAGMGKTRLVNALAIRARRLGCVVISGGCSEA